MTKVDIATNASRFFNRALLTLKKQSPEILLAVGIVGTVASTVLACRASTKVSQLMDNTKKEIEQIHQCSETMPEEYSLEDKKKDLTIVYAKTGLNLAKMYAPAVSLGALSIVSILASHNIIKQRNVALAAAYTAVDKSFKDYRSRVVDRFGKELDRELRFNIKAKEIEETVVDEKGKEKVVKKTVHVADIDPHNKHTELTRCFEAGCNGWSKDAEFNHMFLNHVQRQLTDKLQKEGYLLLNEAYEALGFQKTAAGQVVGWSLKHPKSDGYVDFGIYDMSDAKKVDFVNGYETNIWLDFNCDGNILDYI